MRVAGAWEGTEQIWHMRTCSLISVTSDGFIYLKFSLRPNFRLAKMWQGKYKWFPDTLHPEFLFGKILLHLLSTIFQEDSDTEKGWICVEVFCFPNSPRNVPLYQNPSGRNLPITKAIDFLPLLAPPSPFAKSTEGEEVCTWGCCQDRETVWTRKESPEQKECILRRKGSVHHTTHKTTRKIPTTNQSNLSGREQVSLCPLCRCWPFPSAKTFRDTCPICQLLT